MEWKKVALIGVLALFALSIVAYVIVTMAPYNATPTPTPIPAGANKTELDMAKPGIPPFDYRSDVFFFYSNNCPYCHDQIGTTFAAAYGQNLTVQKINVDASAEGWHFYLINANVSNCSGLPYTIIKMPNEYRTSLCGMYTHDMFLDAYNGEKVEGFVNKTVETLVNESRIVQNVVR